MHLFHFVDLIPYMTKAVINNILHFIILKKVYRLSSKFVPVSLFVDLLSLHGSKSSCFKSLHPEVAEESCETSPLYC